MRKTIHISENGSIWGEDDDVDRLLDRYAAPELGYKSAGAVSIEDVDITEAEAVEIAAAIYKSINGARESIILYRV